MGLARQDVLTSLADPQDKVRVMYQLLVDNIYLSEKLANGILTL
jgi:hypothetical protein